MFQASYVSGSGQLVGAIVTADMVSWYGMSSYTSITSCISSYQVFDGISICNACKNDGVYNISSRNVT
jgi:hypothetical protein